MSIAGDGFEGRCHKVIKRPASQIVRQQLGNANTMRTFTIKDSLGNKSDRKKTTLRHRFQAICDALSAVANLFERPLVAVAAMKEEVQQEKLAAEDKQEEDSLDN